MSKINGKQTLKLRSGSIKFINYFKQLAAPLKFMLIFNAILKKLRIVIEVIILHPLKSIKNTFLAALLIRLFILMINLVSQLFFTEEEIQSINSLKQFLKSMIIVKTWLINILTKILLCLQKMRKGFNQVISAGYVINYLMWEIIK